MHFRLYHHYYVHHLSHLHADNTCSFQDNPDQFEFQISNTDPGGDEQIIRLKASL